MLWFIISALLLIAFIGYTDTGTPRRPKGSRWNDAESPRDAGKKLSSLK